MSLFLQAIFAASILSQGQPSLALRLKTGDVLTISAPSNYGGDFAVMNDGAIYGKGLGRVHVSGLSVVQSEKAVRTALKRFVKEQLVFVTLKSQRPDFVFLVGQTGGQGPTPWQPEMTLRQLIAQVNLPSGMDELEVSVTRTGASIFRATVQDTIAPGNANDPKLQANDVVSILPVDQIRIWVSGAVRTPGEFRIRSGSDLSRAIAAAGGLALAGEGPLDEAQVIVRRGPNVTQYPAKELARLKRIPIEPGDDISVVMPSSLRVTVAGEAVRTGEFILRGDSKLRKAIAMAGGPTTQGTLSMVRVLRQSEMFLLDATKRDLAFELQPNDLVVIERNQRTLYVLGEVAKPGRFLMEDERQYRLSDALAEAGGLSAKGTFRRVYLARAEANGKTNLRQFNLDEYLKDGKLESNPLLQPGDCILFGQSNGLSFNAATQVLSSFILINSLVGKN